MKNKTLKQLVEDLNFKVLTNEARLDTVPKSAYVSDLLSDVMGKAQEDMLWITSQVHKNIVAVASLKDLSAIVIVNERQVDAEVIAHANEESVTLIVTNKPMFETTGLIYNYLK